MALIIKFSNENISQNNLKNNLSKKNGASVFFIGIIKNKNKNKKVNFILYDVIKSLFNRIIKKKCLSLLKNNKNITIYINQYSGLLKSGKINIIININSKDRKNAFILCHQLIEFIKYNTPIWKKEYYKNNKTKWIF